MSAAWDGAPNGNRTRVFAVKGRRPGPLDDGRGLVENPVLPDRRDAIRSAVRAGKPDGRPRKTTATNTEETMRAIRIDHPGGPEVMRLEEVELPPLAKGEVRLRQHAIGINFIDIYHRTGFYPPAKTPFPPGSEGAGEVLEVGPSVEGWRW